MYQTTTLAMQVYTKPEGVNCTRPQHLTIALSQKVYQNVYQTTTLDANTYLHCVRKCSRKLNTGTLLSENYILVHSCQKTTLPVTIAL